MLRSFFRRINAFRRKQYLQDPLFHTQKKYAFVGVGMHSLTNLYPVIKHFGISLKYICTKNSSPTEMRFLFPEAIITHDIQSILSDHSVEAVFISAGDSEHFGLLQKFLGSGKKIFVEKPPCETFDELKQLINNGPAESCVVGLQRRYWPANRIIQRKIRKARNYSYQFHTGSLVNGDPFTGLFIHPLDYALFLFGPATLKSHSLAKGDGGVTIQMHLLHDSGTSGLVECSTEYSWTSPVETLMVNCTDESLKIKYPVLVEGEQKPARIPGLPAERILNQPVTIRRYFSASNFLLPVAENNTLYIQGFYGELKRFIEIAENSAVKQQNDLPSLVNLYEIFDKLRGSRTSS